MCGGVAGLSWPDLHKGPGSIRRNSLIRSSLFSCCSLSVTSLSSLSFCSCGYPAVSGRPGVLLAP